MGRAVDVAGEGEDGVTAAGIWRSGLEACLLERLEEPKKDDIGSAGLSAGQEQVLDFPPTELA